MYSKEIDDYIEKYGVPIIETKRLRHAQSILVSVELFKDIEKVISQRVKNETYQVKYTCKSKGIPERYYTSVHDLEKCDNSLNRAIETLIMDVSAGDDFSLHLVFGKATLEDLLPSFDGLPLPAPLNVHGEIKGIEKQIAEVKADIDYQLRRYSHNKIYSFLSYAGVLFTLMLTAVLFRVYYHFFGLPKTYNIPILGITNRPFDPATFWGKVLPSVRLWSFAFYSAVYIRNSIKRLLPRVKFVMGDNQDLEQRKRTLAERIVWDVIFVFIMNLIFLFVDYYYF